MSDGTLESYQSVARLTQLVKSAPTSVTVGGEIIAYSFTGAIAPANISNVASSALRTEGWGKVTPEYVSAGAINTHLRSNQTWGKVDPPRISPGTNNTMVSDTTWGQVDPVRIAPGAANTVLVGSWSLLPIAVIAPQTNSRAITVSGVSTWVSAAFKGIYTSQYRTNIASVPSFVKFNPPSSANFVGGVYTVPFNGVYLLNVKSFDRNESGMNYNTTQYAFTKSSSPPSGPFTFDIMFSNVGVFVTGVATSCYLACSRLYVLTAGDQYELRYYAPGPGTLAEISIFLSLVPLTKI